ncbi:LysR family transcriptional regulator [Rhodophyticola sp. CCM32]|uniref:LysR family transcriptional regulator n=1 Tax=Rhodophyticola sp. CCM32 TaxID=2916397 RepID=UPI00143DD34C|nr:LysR family transcriptional regulator [Rhodophyticola sp. CCM32]
MLHIRFMEWSDLRIFLAVAQLGSLRRAAERLGVTQPTVARRVQKLEADIGFPLFLRDRDGHRLTPAGADLLPEIRAVESAALRVEQRTLGVSQHLKETVRVGAGETSAAVLARGLHLLGDGPAVELIITDRPSPFQTRAPEIRVLHDMPKTETGLTRRVGSVGCAVYGHESYARARALPLSRDDLRTLPWLAFVEEQSHYVTMGWLQDLMRGRPPASRLMNTDLMLAAAASKTGIAVLPCFKGDASPDLMRLSEEIDALRAEYWTIIQPDLARNTAVRVVSDWIVQCFRDIRA